jgi:hypothetical protein
MEVTVSFSSIAKMAHRQAEIRVARSVGEIELLRSAWNAWQKHPNSDIDFYLMIDRSRSGDLQPYVNVLYRNSRPEAMLVGRIETCNFDLTLGYARIPGPQVRILNIIYQGILGNLSTENSELLLHDVSNALQRREADVACFRYVRSDMPIYDILRRSPPFLERDHCVTTQIHRGMTLPNNVDDLHSRFSAKVRKNHRWQAKKLLQDHHGDVHILKFQKVSDLDQLFRDAEQIACRTYQRSLGVGFEDNTIMRTRLRFEAEKDSLLAHILYVSGRPVAFWIGTVYQHTFFSSSMGYDANFARYSPGMYLLLNAIEGLCNSESNVHFIDFGLGDAQYKALLGDRCWTEASIHVFAPRIRSMALNMMRTPIFRFESSLKGFLGKADLLMMTKRLWRQRVLEKDSRGRTA